MEEVKKDILDGNLDSAHIRLQNIQFDPQELGSLINEQCAHLLEQLNSRRILKRDCLARLKQLLTWVDTAIDLPSIQMARTWVNDQEEEKKQLQNQLQAAISQDQPKSCMLVLLPLAVKAKRGFNLPTSFIQELERHPQPLRFLLRMVECIPSHHDTVFEIRSSTGEIITGNYADVRAFVSSLISLAGDQEKPINSQYKRELVIEHDKESDGIKKMKNVLGNSSSKPLKKEASLLDSEDYDYLESLLLNHRVTPAVFLFLDVLCLPLQKEEKKNVFDAILTRLVSSNAPRELFKFAKLYGFIHSFRLEDLAVQLIEQNDFNSLFEVAEWNYENPKRILEYMENKCKHQLAATLDTRLHFSTLFGKEKQAMDVAERKCCSYANSCTKLIKKFNANIVEYPNVILAHRFRSLRFLIYRLKRLYLSQPQPDSHSGNKSQHVFGESILELIEGWMTDIGECSDRFAKFVVHRLYYSEMLAICTRISMKFHITEYYDQFECPRRLSDIEQLGSAMEEEDFKEEGNNMNGSNPSYQPVYKITCSSQVVDNPTAAQELLSLLKKDADQDVTRFLVGMDCEWFPDFLALPGSSEVPPAIFQLAIQPVHISVGPEKEKWTCLTERQCFIVDLIHLDRVLIVDIITQLFRSRACKKLGFDFKYDTQKLAMFFDVLPNMVNFQDLKELPIHIPTTFVPLEKLNSTTSTVSIEPSSSVASSSSIASVKKPKKPKKPKVTQKKNFSLSDLAKEYLGKSLDKSEQISAWNRRPLRPNQVLYASADASVLVDIYLKYLEK